MILEQDKHEHQKITESFEAANANVTARDGT